MADIAEREEFISKELTVKNKLGIHARPAALFVKIANRFVCELIVEKDGEEVNGKSIMGLMMLAAGQGSNIKLIATGEDAQESIDALSELVNSGFEQWED